MTAVESSAIPAMTADKGDGTAVADLAMTDDCRVGHVSTVKRKRHPSDRRPTRWLASKRA